jgi:hypothetical protein
MMQLILIVLTKRKETIPYCESFRYGVATISLLKLACVIV